MSFGHRGWPLPSESPPTLVRRRLVEIKFQFGFAQMKNTSNRAAIWPPGFTQSFTITWASRYLIDRNKRRVLYRDTSWVQNEAGTTKHFGRERAAVKKQERKKRIRAVSPPDAIPESDPSYPIIAAILSVVPASRWSFAREI